MAHGRNIHALIIDPQNGFMDRPAGSLAVPGATADMQRLAALFDRAGRRIRETHVTLDSHQLIDVGHPAMWRGPDGKEPPSFTAITADDIRAGRWTPRNENARPGVLGGKTIKEYFIWYAEQLEAGGQYLLMVWPVHCLIGSDGYAVQGDLFAALLRWQVECFKTVDWVAKGTNIWTEHYGALQAEVPMPNDPTTTLNTRLLDMLAEADEIVVAGEALSHCVRATVTQVADHIGTEHIRKFHILTDCSSPVPKVGDGPDFPAIAQDFLRDMESRGMTLTTSVEYLA